MDSIHHWSETFLFQPPFSIWYILFRSSPDVEVMLENFNHTLKSLFNSTWALYDECTAKEFAFQKLDFVELSLGM